MSLAATVASTLPLRTSTFLVRTAPSTIAAFASTSATVNAATARAGSTSAVEAKNVCSLPSRGRLSGVLQPLVWSPVPHHHIERRSLASGVSGRMHQQRQQHQQQPARRGPPLPQQRVPPSAMRKPGYVPPPAPTSASSATSIFDEELNRCTDGPAVLAVGSRTQLPLNEQDVRLFLDRLVKIPKVPRQGHDLHTVIKKVIATTEKSDLDLRVFVMLRFGDLKLRPGMVAAWPLVQPHLHQLPASVLADVFWAASAIPKPLPEVVEQLEETSNLLALRLKDIPLDELPLSIYRCLYGLARSVRPGRCVEFRKRSQKLLLDKVFPTIRPGHSPWLPPQLVRLVWSLGRLGCRETIMYSKLEPLLRHVISEFTERELEALYQIFTGLELVEQRRLIHDVERALQAREESRSGDPDKAPRRKQFRKKWTRANPLTHPVVKKPTHRR